MPSSAPSLQLTLPRVSEGWWPPGGWRCRLHSPDTVKRLQLSGPGLGCGLGAHAIGGRGRRPCGAVVTSVGRAQAEGPPHHHPPLTLAPAASLSLSDQPRVQALDRVPATSLHCSLRRDISVYFIISDKCISHCHYLQYIRISMSPHCRGGCRTMLVCWCHCVCYDGIARLDHALTASTPQHSPINLDCSPPLTVDTWIIKCYFLKSVLLYEILI